VGGIRIVLKPGGVATLEFPHLVRLMRENQYDTIYHEHFSHFSLITGRQLGYAREWGAKFIVPIPQAQVFA
jgi:hypothetical protein